MVVKREVWQASIGGAVQKGEEHSLCKHVAIGYLTAPLPTQASILEQSSAVSCVWPFSFSSDPTLNAAASTRTIRRPASPVPPGGPCPVPRYTAIVNILLDGREVPFTVTLCGYL